MAELAVATLDTFRNRVTHTDAETLLRSLPAGSVHCIVTSPPYYGLRDYGTPDQLGLEDTPEQYIAGLVAVFREAWRALRDDGLLFVNIGDSYWGGKGQSGHADADRQLERVISGESFNAPAAHVGGHGKTRPTDRRLPKRYRLRSDLTPSELAYVLTELAKTR